MLLRRTCTVALGIVTLFGFVSAQNVLVVSKIPGPNVFSSDIQLAVNAASSGDIILVHPGSYIQFNVSGKALSVLAYTEAAVGTIQVQNLQATQQVTIRGFVIPQVSGSFPRVSLKNNAGPVWIEDCTFVYTSGTAAIGSVPGVDISNSTSIALTRCSVFGAVGSVSGPGIHVVQSTVYAYDCELVGAFGIALPFISVGTGGVGVNVESGMFFASGSTIQGGPGGDALVGSMNGADGGIGLVTAGDAILLGCKVAGGDGGAGVGGGAAGVPGVPSVIQGNGAITTLPGAARHFSADSPVLEINSLALTFTGTPGENAGLIVSSEPQIGTYMPLLSGALLPSLATANTFTLGVIPPSGTLQKSFPAPSLPSAALGSTLYAQSVFFDSQLTYAVLGTPSALTVLDPLVAPGPHILTSGTMAPATVGIGYSYILQGQYGSTWSASGLPQGLEVDAITGVIVGVPTQSGTFSVVVNLHSPIQPTVDSKTLTLNVGTCTSATPAAFGAGTPGCNGPHVIGASSCAKVGDTGYFLISNHAPANATGVALVTDVADIAGSDLLGLGFLLHVDLTASSLVLHSPFYSDEHGSGAASLPIPASPGLVGAEVFAQAVWIWGSPCPSAPTGFSSSPGVRIHIQP